MAEAGLLKRFAMGEELF